MILLNGIILTDSYVLFGTDSENKVRIYLTGSNFLKNWRISFENLYIFYANNNSL